jgi:hypothetical protein
MKIYLIYGFAMAVAGAVLGVGLYLLGFHSDPSKLAMAQILGGVFGITIGVVCITLGTKARRAQIPATEEFGYGRALGAGVMIALWASLFGIVTTILYATVINPDFVDVIVQAQLEKFEAKGMTAAQIEGAERMVRKMTSPGIQACFNFAGGLFFGTLISLVTAAFLKRPAAPVHYDAPPVVS